MSNSIDNSVRTKLRIERKAELNVRAYRSAYNKELNREIGVEFLLMILGKLFWFFLIYPTLYLIHFLFQSFLILLTGSKNINTHLRNPVK